MSVKIIAQLHPLRSSRIKVTTSSKSVRKILEELNSGFPLSQARVCRNGEIIKDFSLIANDDDVLAIKYVPAGGGEMKAAGWVMAFIGVVLIAGLGWTGVGGAAGMALIGSGLGLALGGQVLLGINIPKPSDKEKPENDPSIRGAKNQARPHGRIPVLFGKHRIYPDLAANQHTEIIGNQQYLNLLFCGGYKDYTIDKNSFKLGETLITDLSQTKDINQILSHQDPIIDLDILQDGETSRLYPYCVHEDMLNAALQNQVEDGDGNKVSGAIERTTPDNTDKINVDIFLQNGIGRYNDKGEIGTASATVNIFFKKDNESYTLMAVLEISGQELKTKRYQATKAGLTPGKYTVKIERFTPDSTDSKTVDQIHVGSIRSYKTKRPIRENRQKDLTIIAMRVLATAKLNGVIDSFNYVATSKLPVHTQTGSGPLYWSEPAETQNPAAMLMYALQGRAAQQIVDDDDIDYPSIEEFYAWCEKKDEDGDYKYMCNAYLSESVTIAELIKMIGSTSRADILRIDSKIAVVQDIERPAPVQLFTPKNTISYGVTMMKADVPDMISMRFIDEKAGYAQNDVKVYNTPSGAQGDYEIEPRANQKIDLWGITNSKQARRLGMYNYACVKNRPFVHNIEVDIEYLLCNKGDCIQYAGDIALAGTTQGRIKGLIFIDDIIVGIDTDEPIVMESGKQHAVRVRLKDGTIILKEVRYNPGLQREKSISYFPGNEDDLYDPFVGDMYAVDEKNNVYYEPQNIIYFIEPISDINILNNIKAGNLYAFGVRGYEVIDLIITDLQPGSNLTASLTCVEHAPEIFGVDDPNFELPPFENKITPVSGAVDPGTITPSNWRNFAVFNDSEDEPPRPSGDGQGDGWYKLETFRSIWQSSKVAESIDSGEWGSPVRIKAHRGTEDITPIWLSLDPQNISFEIDVNGNALAGPEKTSQARLMQWNSLLSGAEFSLVGAPEGITINQYGLITIANNTVINKELTIIVNARYQGGNYSAALTVKKNANNIPRGYLGTVQSFASMTSAKVTTNRGSFDAIQTDYVLAITSISGREKGSIFQWTGSNWEYRSVNTHSDLYMSGLPDGLDALGKSTEWFAAILTRNLMAIDAFIQKLQTLEIVLQNLGSIKSAATDDKGDPLFKIAASGDAIFRKMTAINALIKGTLLTGNAWNEDGSINKPEARGSFFALNKDLDGNNQEIRVKNLALYGDTIIGMNHGNKEATTVLGGKTRAQKFHIDNFGYLAVTQEKYLIGRVNVASFVENIRFIYGNQDTSFAFPVRGNIYYTYEGQGGSTNVLNLNVDVITFSNASYDQTTSAIAAIAAGTNLLHVYANRIIVYNRAGQLPTAPLPAPIVTIDAIKTFDVSILFI